jgi:hypothetical protein
VVVFASIIVVVDVDVDVIVDVALLVVFTAVQQHKTFM